MYAKAFAGNQKENSGVNDPYGDLDPEILLNTRNH
jgi:hypothetical protein